MNSEDSNSNNNSSTPPTPPVPTEEEILYFRSVMINFVNKNKAQIVEIYVKHKNESGEDGVMMLMMGLNKIDVSYIPTSTVPESLKPILENRKEENNNNSNIIYLVMVTPAEASIVEVDIRDLA